MKRASFIALAILPYIGAAYQQKQTQRPQASTQHQQPSNPIDPEFLIQLQQEIAQRTLNQANGVAAAAAEAAARAPAHVRICPTCGDLSENCSTDQSRLKRGEILPCGCPSCGGLRY